MQEADREFVQNLAAEIARARVAEARARQRHVEDIARDLRAEFRREVIELREEMGEMLAGVHKALDTERTCRESGDRALGNTLDARTERFV